MKQEDKTPEQIREEEQRRAQAAEIVAGLTLITDPVSGREVFDVSDYPTDAKGRPIVPDVLMEFHYRRLPDGTVNQTGNYRAYHGGRMFSIGAGGEKEKSIVTAGGKALQANLKQRRTLKEETQIALCAKAPKDMAEAAGLEYGASVQEVATAAMARRAMQGDRGALEYIRDTAGEKPTERQEITADIMTDADRALLRQVQSRIATTSCVDVGQEEEPTTD